MQDPLSTLRRRVRDGLRLDSEGAEAAHRGLDIELTTMRIGALIDICLRHAEDAAGVSRETGFVDNCEAVALLIDALAQLERMEPDPPVPIAGDPVLELSSQTLGRLQTHVQTFADLNGAQLELARKIGDAAAEGAMQLAIESALVN